MAKLGIDLDDVIAASWDLVLPFLNDRFRTQLRNDDIVSYNLSSLFGVDSSDIKEAYRILSVQGAFLEAPVIEGASEVIPALSRNHELYIITSRPLYLKDDTHSWIDRHFGKSFRDIYFTSHPADLNDSDIIMESKADICAGQGICGLLDDCVDHVVNCHNRGVKGFLFDFKGKYGWTKSCTVKEIMRVNSLYEFEDLARQL